MDILRKIEEYAACQGERTAFRSRTGEISYGELWERSGRLASVIENLMCDNRDPVIVYGPRCWNNKKDGRRVVWRCGKKYGKNKSCGSPLMQEEELKDKFISAFNEIYDDREMILERCREILAELDDSSKIDAKIREHEMECEMISDMNLKLMKDSALKNWDDSDVQEQIDLNVRNYDEKYAKVEKLKTLKQERIQRAEKLSLFMFGLHEREGMIERFDEKLWITTVDTATVLADGSVVFHFKNGMEVTR